MKYKDNERQLNKRLMNIKGVYQDVVIWQNRYNR